MPHPPQQRGRPEMPDADNDPLIDDPADDGPAGTSPYVRRLTGAEILGVTEKTVNRYRSADITAGAVPLLTTYRPRARPFEVWLSRTEVAHLHTALTDPLIADGPTQERAGRLAARMEQLRLLDVAREHQNT
jgi:hypothetical protein